MVSLVVIVFLIEAAVRLVNAFGADAINNLLWTLVTQLPIKASKQAAERRKLQAEYLKVRQELNATSSQDEFAKWARVRRQHDKLLEQLDAAKKGAEASRARFDKYLNGVRIVLTRAPQQLLPFMYAKQPMFWLPHGWFPYYAEWIVSFPRAPIGSVSIASWQLACTSVIAILAEIISAVFSAVRGGKQRTAPVKSSAEKPGEAKTESKPEAKKTQ